MIPGEMYEKATMGRCASAWAWIASIGRRQRMGDGPIVVTYYRTVTGKTVVLRVDQRPWDVATFTQEPPTARRALHRCTDGILDDGSVCGDCYYAKHGEDR